MKECEKRIEELPILSIDLSPVWAQEEGFRQGWKAALEWALKQDPGFCACGAMNVIYDGEEYKPTLFDVIQQELREE